MNTPSIIATVFLLLINTSLYAIDNSSKVSIDQELRLLSKQLKLTGTPKAKLPLPSIHSQLSQLGMKLFYSKILGGEKDVACVSCHHPLLGGGDNLSLSIGTHAQHPNVLGQKRALKAGYKLEVPRNAPSTFNAAFYTKTLFHDGRIKALDNKQGISTPDVALEKEDLLGGENLLQAQARFPITSPAEMRGDFMPKAHNQTLRRALANRLKKNWLSEFRRGFSDTHSSADDLITEQNISLAIAEYEASQIFINNPWRKYLQGDNSAISDNAKQGALIFFKPVNKGGANCNRCHSGDFFTDELFHNTAVPQIGAGIGVGSTKTNDDGCGSITKKKHDKFRFRTPTLLNTEVTGPWGHDGAYTSLESITRHMLSPLKSISGFDKKQLTQKKIQVKDINKNTLEASLTGLELTSIKNISDKDVANLLAFLKTLTDPCVKSRECLSPWIPSKNDNDPDGLMLHAQIE
jgi:cytochrome c peroxidase